MRSAWPPEKKTLPAGHRRRVIAGDPGNRVNRASRWTRPFCFNFQQSDKQNNFDEKSLEDDDDVTISHS